MKSAPKKYYAEGTGDVSSDDSSGAPPINININGQPGQNASQAPAAWTPAQYRPDPKILEAHERLRQYYANMPGGQLAGSPDGRASEDLQNLNEYQEKPDSFSSSSAGHMKDVQAIASPEQGAQQQAPAAQDLAPPQEAAAPDQGLAANANAPDESQQTAPANDEARTPASAPEEAEDAAAVAPQQTAPKTPQQNYQDHYAKTYAEVTAENNAIEQDLKNGKITPKTYHDLFADKSTLGKIGMIFGVLASGAGAGLTHQPSALLEMMNNQIKNDNEMQQRSQENAQNLIKLNQNRLANESGSNLTEAQAEMHATQTALMQKNLFAMDHLSRMVQNLPVGSQQRVQAERALGLMYPAMTNENSTIASRMAAANAWYNTMQGMNGAGTGGSEGAFQARTNTMRMMGPQGEMMAKNLEDKHMPGFSGQASASLDSRKKDELKKYSEFDQQLSRFMDWTKKHSGSLNPAEINEGKVLASNLQSKYREAALNTVYRPGEQPLLNQVIPSDPTKFLNKWRVLPQLQALKKENESQLNTAANLEGLGKYVGFNKESSMPSSTGEEIERLDPKTGKTVIYDANTKKPLRWK